MAAVPCGLCHFFGTAQSQLPPWHHSPGIPPLAAFAAAFCSLGSLQGLSRTLVSWSHLFWCGGFWHSWGWLRAPHGHRCLLDMAGSPLLLWHCIFTDLCAPSLLLHLHRGHMETSCIPGKSCPGFSQYHVAHGSMGSLVILLGLPSRLTRLGHRGPSFNSPPLVPGVVQALSGCAEGADIIAVVVARQQDLSVMASGSASLCWNLGRPQPVGCDVPWSRAPPALAGPPSPLGADSGTGCLVLSQVSQVLTVDAVVRGSLQAQALVAPSTALGQLQQQGCRLLFQPLVTWHHFLQFLVATPRKVLNATARPTPSAVFVCLAQHLSPCRLPPVLCHFG